MEDLCRGEIEKPSKSANPGSRFIIKFQCRYKGWKSGGTDAKRLTDVFGACWIGTETRNNNPDALQACWICDPKASAQK